MNKDTPINAEIVNKKLAANNIDSVGKASIREIKKLVDDIEKESGERFVRMEMGIPGLPASEIGVNAEIEALKNGVASTYPDIQGIPKLKTEMSRFVKNFLNVEVAPEHCLPTVGSMQGGFAAFMTTTRMHKDKDTVLFIDPGFPVQKMQCQVLGIPYETFDVYNYRGDKLEEKLEAYLSKGNISTIIYSNPNNPSWICFTDKELQIIGKMANKYDVVIIEDLAYIGMDFRKDISKPGEPPYQDTVAQYTDNYIMLISSSKSFSYAGQRVGMFIIADALYEKKCPDLKRFYNSEGFGHNLLFSTIYPLSAGTSHAPQYGLAAMLKAVNDGEYNFIEEVKEYGEKAKIMKKLFTDNGFEIVYDKDEDQPIADGFYFTISYPGLDGEELIHKLVFYGISAISLDITGSERTEGLRACVSLVSRNQFPDLENRLIQFHKDHKNLK
ncbi:MAG: pyridoxal phosphate-dependent aminotransferase [Bacteroidales bacterium]|nr:pyridoxal phosphate-dependent aminotransferase [Bacteroidales bacterium]MCF8328486.1 pyridoxal phosphate-dependent aminotransferase [Bacteroidales bacterium]